MAHCTDKKAALHSPTFLMGTIGPLIYAVNRLIDLPIWWLLIGGAALLLFLPIISLVLLISAFKARGVQERMAAAALCVVNAGLFLIVFIPIITVCWDE
jgi:hypothetical protein